MSGTTVASGSGWTGEEAVVSGYRERVVTFGPDDGLVGIVTEPAAPRRDGRTPPAVLLSNVGLNHRVGPSRAWVELARRLAILGVPSLRFDASGIGDSAPRSGEADALQRAVLDLEDAVAWAVEHLAPRTVLVANCSGTDNAHVVATRDPRVVGAVFLDGYNYPTWRYYLHEHALRFVGRRNWLRYFRRTYPHWFGLPVARTRSPGRTELIYQRVWPSRERFVADVATMEARGVRLLFVYSGETGYTYPGQFWDWMRRRPMREGPLAVEYYPEANHTYSYRQARERMLDRVAAWVAEMV